MIAQTITKKFYMKLEIFKSDCELTAFRILKQTPSIEGVGNICQVADVSVASCTFPETQIQNDRIEWSTIYSIETCYISQAISRRYIRDLAKNDIETYWEDIKRTFRHSLKTKNSIFLFLQGESSHRNHYLVVLPTKRMKPVLSMLSKEFHKRECKVLTEKLINVSDVIYVC